CKKVALGHYENFPVGSLLLPQHLRNHIFALYAFMRSADDFADLPHRTKKERVALLEDWRQKLHDAFKGNAQVPTFVALQDTVQKFDLPIEPFSLLLDAFTFDAEARVEFPTYDDLHWYTARSAEPVGQLVLALFGYRDAECIRCSNDICTALQLINFLQDAKEDLVNGRCYFPKVDYTSFGISTAHEILTSPYSSKLILFESERVERLLESGAHLPSLVRGRLRFELKAVLAGAQIVIKKIRDLHGDTLRHRPTLSRFEKTKIIISGFAASQDFYRTRAVGTHDE